MTMLEALHAAFETATADILFLPPDPAAAERIRQQYQVREDSLLGTILTQSGGIVFDRWLRLYGAGSLNFAARNEQLAPFHALVVAEDVCGGLFSLTEEGTLSYFSPDTLTWEDFPVTYPQFVQWCADRDRTALFYETFRSPEWVKDVAELTLDQGLSIMPPLWSKESAQGFSVRAVPIKEIFDLELELSKTLSS